MRTESDQLGDLLFGQTRGRILRLLFGHPDQTFFVRQLARETGISVGSVQRELETLSQVGLIVRSISGHQVYQQANRNHPVFAEIHALVAKTVGVFQLLSSALAPLAQRITQAFVYGSVASRIQPTLPSCFFRDSSSAPIRNTFSPRMTDLRKWLPL